MSRNTLALLASTTVFFAASTSWAAEEAVIYPHEIPLIKLVATQQALVPAATVPQLDGAYKLQAGDMLRINVWKEEELDREVLVMPDGTIDFPLIGSFSVVGQSTSDVQRLVTAKLQPFIPAASVTVVAKETRGNAVSVIGQVTKPGEVIMTRAMTVMQALSQAGGLTPYADDDDIVILRKNGGKEDSIEFDYSDIARGRNLETNITLLPGDVIVVPTQSLF